jgi:hypothetical protein
MVAGRRRAACRCSAAPATPAYQTILSLPQTSGDLRDDADATGCIFVGPTRLVLNSAGTMTTTSPFTTATTTDADNYNRCVGNNKALPGVLFTRNAKTSSPDETSGQCTGYTGNRIGFPIQNVGGDSSADDITRYGCASGDIFVSGVLNGRMTVAAENDVVVVDDVTYQSYGQTTEDDLLGLIAEQFVRVYHPISCPSSYVVDVNSVRTCQDDRGANLADSRFNTDTGGLFSDPKIHAAILALNHSFGVQQYNNGDQLGTLTVYGASPRSGVARSPSSASPATSRTTATTRACSTRARPASWTRSASPGRSRRSPRWPTRPRARRPGCRCASRPDPQPEAAISTPKITSTTRVMSRPMAASTAAMMLVTRPAVTIGSPPRAPPASTIRRLATRAMTIPAMAPARPTSQTTGPRKSQPTTHPNRFTARLVTPVIMAPVAIGSFGGAIGMGPYGPQATGG